MYFQVWHMFNNAKEQPSEEVEVGAEEQEEGRRCNMFITWRVFLNIVQHVVDLEGRHVMNVHRFYCHGSILGNFCRDSLPALRAALSLQGSSAALREIENQGER
jgi:hypothetical protein